LSFSLLPSAFPVFFVHFPKGILVAIIQNNSAH
jgi:hypothetical protein